MKKSVIPAIALLLGLCACNEDEVKDSISFTIETYTHVTDGEMASVSPVSYDFTFERISRKAEISTSDLRLAGVEKKEFNLSPIPYVAGNFTYDDGSYAWVEVKDAAPSGTGMAITDLNCQLTTAKITPFAEKETAESLLALQRLFPENRPSNGMTGYYPVMTYKAEGMTLRTFWSDETFVGKMTVPGMGGTMYENEDVKSRVIMDFSDVRGYKANVLLIGAKFSPKMPPLNLILRDIPLTLTPGGYELANAGEIVPSYLEGGKEIPNDNYPFVDFRLTCGGDLTDATVAFKVRVSAMGNAEIAGTFIGSCAFLPTL